MRRATILCAAGLMCCAALWPSGAVARDTKVVLLAGKKSHAPGEHEYEKGMLLVRHCLDTALNVRHVLVEVHSRGWPQDERTLDDADTIVYFGDGGSRATRHPLVAGNHMPALGRQMQRGCGLVVIHWGLNLPSKIGSETFLRWIGGFKDYENPPRRIGEPLRVADWTKQAAHPICRGLKPFDMPTDEYKTPERLLSDQPGFVPILPFPGKPGAPLWAWAWQRDDGGRGFGLIGGHNHTIWNIEDLRKAVNTVEKAVRDIDGKIAHEDSDFNKLVANVQRITSDLAQMTGSGTGTGTGTGTGADGGVASPNGDAGDIRATGENLLRRL